MSRWTPPGEPDPDQPLWEMGPRMDPAAAPMATLTLYQLNPEEKRKLAKRKRRPFGFARELSR